MPAKYIAMTLFLLNAAAATLGTEIAVSPQIAKRRASAQTLELRILAGQLDKGLPTSFTFVFLNKADHELKMPRPTQCFAGSGTVLLRSEFKPLKTTGVGRSGGGAYGGLFDGRTKVLDWVKSWQTLEPGASFSVSYLRQELFNFQQDAGDYEFWGAYEPPKLTIEEISILERAGIHFPQVPLLSEHLHFKRPT